jgi:hypothetical protein
MLAGISVGSDKGLLQLYEGFGLLTHMKSALLAAIFAITAAPHACRPPTSKLLREISYRFHQPPKTSASEIIS